MQIVRTQPTSNSDVVSSLLAGTLTGTFTGTLTGALTSTLTSTLSDTLTGTLWNIYRSFVRVYRVFIYLLFYISVPQVPNGIATDTGR